MTRTRYLVSYRASDRTWGVKQLTKPTRGRKRLNWAGFLRKSFAVKAARTAAKANKPSQVIVRKRDGRIQTEYTYGNDPRKYKG